MARIYFAVDVHGNTTIWKKWLKMPERHKADILMLCGDLTGKMLVPLIGQDDGSYVCSYFGKPERLKTEDEIKNMERSISAVGYYPFKTTPEEIEELKRNPMKVDNLMDECMVKRMREWMELLVSRVDTKGLTVVVMPGNDDRFVIDDVIKGYEDEGIIYPLDKVIDVAGFETISMAYTNPTPWDTPRETSERELKRMIEEKVKKLSDPSKSIFNFHCPPYNTRLDNAPKLDKRLKPIADLSGVEFVHVGSKEVRKAIEKYQPVVGLHGHIHESYGADRIGNTLIFNPGSEYGEGILRALIIDVSKDKGVEKYWKVEA